MKTDEQTHCINPDCGKLTRSHPIGPGLHVCHGCWEKLPKENLKHLIDKELEKQTDIAIPEFDMKKIEDELNKQGMQLFDTGDTKMLIRGADVNIQGRKEPTE